MMSQLNVEVQPSSEVVSRLSRIVKGWLLGCGLVTALCVFWKMHFECPSLLGTIACAFVAYTAGVGGILAFCHSRPFGSFERWNYAFLAKILLSVMILAVFWTGPLTPEQYRANDGLLLDMVYYDHHAAELARTGWADAQQHLNFTWLSFGVVAYSSVIYTTFGVNILHIALFNACATLWAALLFGRGVWALTNDFRVSEKAKWIVLLPFGAYFDAIISKDTITSLFFATSFCGACISYSNPRRRNLGALLMVAGIVGLSIIRINVAIIVTGCVGVLFARRLRLQQLLLIAGAIAAGLFAFSMIVPNPTTTLAHLFTLDEFFSSQREFVNRVEGEGASHLKIVVARATIPTSLGDLFLLAPLRTGIWFFNPYPEILPPFGMSVTELLRVRGDDPYEFSGYGHRLGAILSVWGIIGVSPLIWEFMRKPCRAMVGWGVVMWFTLLPVIIIANLSYVGGKRYRILIEPLILLMSAWAAYNGRPGRSVGLVWLILITPLALYALTRIL